MSNSSFDENGADKCGMYWIQYVAFVVTAIANYF